MLKSTLLILAFLMFLEACTSTGGGRQSDSESKCKEANVEVTAEKEVDAKNKFVKITPAFTDAVDGIAKLEFSCKRDGGFDVFEIKLNTDQEPSQDKSETALSVTLECDEMVGDWIYHFPTADNKPDITVTSVACKEVNTN